MWAVMGLPAPPRSCELLTLPPISAAVSPSRKGCPHSPRSTDPCSPLAARPSCSANHSLLPGGRLRPWEHPHTHPDSVHHLGLLVHF